MTETNQETIVNEEEQLSSMEMVWKAAFAEIDAWGERLNQRDEAFLHAARNYADTVKRNRENVKAITEQFTKELREWEKGAREELLVATTPLQYFSPVKSNEEINQVVDNIQKRTASLLTTPLTVLNGNVTMDKYLETVEQYISFRKNAREKYIDSVKKTSTVFYDNQRRFYNLFAKQVKSAVFPFQKYLKSNEVKGNVE